MRLLRYVQRSSTDFRSSGCLKCATLLQELALLKERVEAKNRIIQQVLQVADLTKLSQEAVLEIEQDAQTVTSWFTPQSGEELERGMENGLRQISLRGGVRYHLITHPLTLRPGAHYEFFCADEKNSAVLFSNLIVRDGTSLTATNVVIESAKSSRPCIEAVGAQCRIELSGGGLRSGRDGIYLASGARCTMTNVHISDNKRGLFEGFRCSSIVRRCTFERNWFNAVLLSSPLNRQRIEELQRNQNTFIASDMVRGDIALSYNPVTDVYGDVYRDDGTLVVLTELNNTAELVDATW